MAGTFKSGVVTAWKAVRSNPYFVAFEGGATGAGFSFINDALQSGHLDFSHAGLSRLGSAVLIGGVTAVRLLYRPNPPEKPATPAP